MGKLHYKIISTIVIVSAMLPYTLQAKAVRLTCDPMTGTQLTTVKGETTSKPEVLTNYSNVTLDVPNNIIIFNNDTYKIVNTSTNLVSGVFTTGNSTSILSVRLQTLEISFSHHVAKPFEDYLLSVQGKCKS